MKGAILVFTDGSSNGKAVTIVNGKSHVQVTEETSAQRAELRTVIWAFQYLRDCTFNLLTDSWHKYNRYTKDNKKYNTNKESHQVIREEGKTRKGEEL